MRMTGDAIVHVLALACVSASGLAAQGLSATLALEKPFYWSDDYRDTHGDWQAETTLRYQFDGPFGVGVGGGGGKLDEDYSDPSFSFFWFHVETSLAAHLSRSSRAWIGARYGWAHERVGDRGGGLWAWGWLGGAVGGLSYLVNEHIGIGLHVDVMRLDLRRDELGVAPAGGLDREGWRVSLGPRLTFGRH
jgi:hypothetical protein